MINYDEFRVGTGTQSERALRLMQAYDQGYVDEDFLNGELADLEDEERQQDSMESLGLDY